ncbi:MAG: complex I subunit 1/NuoH family protein [Akkermansiaceae bacterium]
MDHATFIFLISTAVKIFLFTFVLILPIIAYSTYAERRVSAIIQDRVGPNRVGIPLTLFGFKKDIPFSGLLQPLADGLKALLKEDLVPAHVNKFFFCIAPALTAIPAFLSLCVIPFGSSITLFGEEIKLVVADIDAGPLFVFAIASLSVYGITFAGWASNNKFSFLGGVRSCAQMISYEIALGLSVVPVLMVYGQLNLSDIVQAQANGGWTLLPLWNEYGSVFSAEYWKHSGEQWLLMFPLLISFVVFTTSIFAETNRMPFDLPECETELVGGYHTEYSSMKFALFFLGEYAAMIVGSALIVTLFFGGWSVGFGLDESISNLPLGGLIHLGCFLTKLIAFVIFFIWVRWTLPRFRYDQLMKLGWVVFFELALVNIFITAGIIMLIK